MSDRVLLRYLHQCHWSGVRFEQWLANLQAEVRRLQALKRPQIDVDPEEPESADRYQLRLELAMDLREREMARFSVTHI